MNTELLAHQLAAFHYFGCEGMALCTEPVAPEPPPPVRLVGPLVNRCACGRRISDNKTSCRACKGADV
jgi:hypothetical protein